MKREEENDLRNNLCDVIKRVKELEVDNAELIKLVSSKRYKVVSFVIDQSYRVARKVTKIDKIVSRATSNLKKTTNKPFGERKVVSGRVDIININFYDWDGEIVYKGGAERYVYDLACLLKKMGYDTRILQCSNVPFEKKYDGISIIGTGFGDKSNIRLCSEAYNYYCRDAEFVIASPLELASEIRDIPVIGINHGVNFDAEWKAYDVRNMYPYSDFMDALNNVSSCVCVDTNFINFTRTQDYALALKEQYIPNYYDEKMFGVINKKEKKKITFVYPRRLYDARGFDITVKAFKKILPKYKSKVILKFVGQVDNKKVGTILDKLLKEYPKNVFHYEYPMDKMKKAYEDADVVLVPTRYSEGTSLSCIEAMACGSAIIATNVGGLPNLIIDGYNGLLISPVAEDLEEAVIKLIENPSLRKKIAKNGAMVAKESFSKQAWEKRWEEVIQKMQEFLKQA